MTRPGSPRERRCTDCGQPFLARTDVARFCPACRWRHRGRKPVKYCWTEERLDYLREHYVAGKKGVPQAIGAKFGWPSWVVKKKAAELGLTSGVRYIETRREWTAEEDAFLVEHLGTRTCHWIAQKLRRSMTSVALHAKRKRLSRRLRDGYTLRELTLCFGVDHKVISRWIDEGKLARRERPYLDRQGVLCVTDVDLIEFISKHPMEFELCRVDQLWFMDLISGGGLLRRALRIERDVEEESFSVPPPAPAAGSFQGVSHG